MSAPEVLRVAVVGAGVAGAACASALQRAGAQVTVFEKSRGLGGRMATRRARYSDVQGLQEVVDFDHGAQQIAAQDPRFEAAMVQAAAAGVVVPWRPRIAGLISGPIQAQPAASRYLPLPTMPALCQHWLAGVPVQLQATVTRLLRQHDGRWQIQLAEAAGVDGVDTAPLRFDRVVLALPPAQAAALLADHQAAWAQALRGVAMHPCWTLMAVSEAPAAGPRAADWDAQVPTDGPLAWVSRNDRRPDRRTPAGLCSWVAQASASWSQAHLEDDAQAVEAALRQALQACVGGALRIHHAAVHRWRYALAAQVPLARAAPWWDAASGLGLCGDFTRGTDIEAAWFSGDELARAMTATVR